MLGYLRELYEIYATHQEGKPYTPPPVAAAPAPAPPTPTPPPAPVAAPAPPPKPAPAPTPPPAPAPEPTPIPAPVKEVTPPPAPAPKPVEPPKAVTPPTPPEPKPTPPPAPKPVAPPVVTTPGADVRALFTEDTAAGRFGRQPLADLTKALTINNRILFSKDLFGNDNDLLNTSLRTLNTSGSFAAAQPVLESMARRFHWTEEDKAETAKEFIELVRRRYV